MKSTSKLSIKANKIIDDINRTETSIKYRGKGCNGKIAIGYLLELYADDDERKFIQKYVETNSACFGTSITICAYIFAMAAILFTLLWPYLYIHIYKTPVQLYLLVLSLILIYLFRRVFFDTFPKLERNKAIIMSIEDKWKDQDESYSNPNTKKEGKGGTTMKNGSKTVVSVVISIVLLGMVAVAVKYWVEIDNWVPIDIILTSALVIVTAIYAWLTHTIVKQGADRDRIAFIERRLEKLYFPMWDFMWFLDERKVVIHGGDSYGLVLENHVIATKKIDKFVPFQYLATNDVQESWPKINELLHGPPMDSVEYEDTIKTIKDKINRDLEAYTKELKSLLKEE